MRPPNAKLVVVLALTLPVLARCSCSQAKHILKSNGDVSQYKLQHMACFDVQPTHNVAVHLLVPKRNFTGLDSYLQSGLTFARDLAGLGAFGTHMLHPTTFVMSLSDDSTLPATVLARLKQAGVPLVSHALQGRHLAQHVVLAPDFHFIDNHGFAEIRNYMDQHRTLLADKLPTVFWRGSTTGSPAQHFQPDGDASGLNKSAACWALPRVQLAVRARRVAWLDAGISNAVQYCDNDEAAALLRETGVMGASVPWQGWHNYRGIIEIDGNVNAWGHMWRMSTGSVLFRVQSEWVNSYNVAQKPWVHYVPIESDLSNLGLATSLVLSQDERVLAMLATISDNARTLAAQHTYVDELERVGRELDAIVEATKM